ncbi:restriction endonuclease subunit S [Flavobacterium plurextorum]|uniref:restriction endonuclease subunit S n=1 Tax=Flavobacterium plurextorum TaxID=1114867 RepID=UPI00375845A6
MSLIHKVSEIFQNQKFPKNWKTIELDKVVKIQNGFAFKSSYFNSDNIGMPLIRIRDIKNSTMETFYSGAILEDFVIIEGDLLIGMDGDFNSNIWKGNPALLNQRVCRLIPDENFILKKLLFYGLPNYLDKINENTSSTTVKHLSSKSIGEIPFPLPPFAEQNRIVAKLDTLFTQLETMKMSMTKIPLLLQDFRQQVLTQAVTGKLTEEWRKGKELESGEELLKQIKNKRLEIYNRLSLLAIKNGKRKPKQPILEVPDNNKHNFIIPNNWIYCTIGDIGDVSNGSTPSRPIEEYWNGNIPWISSGLVRNNRITNAIEHLTQLGFENSSVKLLPKGSILLAMIGEGKTRGQSAILDIDATINQNIAGIAIEHGLIVSEYLQNWLFVNYENNRQMGNGTGPQALNCQKVRELPFVLPPYLEQQEIVRTVESLFATANAIEKQYKFLKQRIDSLPKAILNKAFKGELIEQLESDGDARQLLDAINRLKEIKLSQKKKE